MNGEFVQINHGRDLSIVGQGVYVFRNMNMDIETNDRKVIDYFAELKGRNELIENIEIITEKSKVTIYSAFEIESIRSEN